MADPTTSISPKFSQELSGFGADPITILVRDRYQRDVIVTGLAERGVEVRPVDVDAVGRGLPVVMTMHRAKGLEFRKVLLFNVSEAAIPRSVRDQEYSEADRADALLRERSLLYVAATRARDKLAISWSGTHPLLETVAFKRRPNATKIDTSFEIGACRDEQQCDSHD